NISQSRDHGGHHGYAGRWTILRNRTSRNVDVDIGVFVKVRLETEFDRIRPHPRERSFGGFLHNVAYLTGHRKMPSALCDVSFHEQDVATNRCPRQADDNAGALHTLFHFFFELILWRAEKFLDYSRRYD